MKNDASQYDSCSYLSGSDNILGPFALLAELNNFACKLLSMCPSVLSFVIGCGFRPTSFLKSQHSSQQELSDILFSVFFLNGPKYQPQCAYNVKD